MKNHAKLFTATAAVALLALGSFARADITGSIKLEGKAPEMKEIDMSGVKECKDQHADPVMEETVVANDKGMLANVVISIKADDPAALGGTAPTEAAVLDQKGCQYSPHVLAVMTGQKLVVKNDDPFLHNVHSQANTNPNFNFGQPNKDAGKEVDSPKAAEVFKVKCDVHPWMGAWVAVFDHPFFAVSGEDGKFTIKGTVPDGEYNVVAWHEKFGTKDGKVTVKDGKGTVDFSFDAGSAAAPDKSEVKYATTSGKSEAKCCGAGCGSDDAKKEDAKK